MHVCVCEFLHARTYAGKTRVHATKNEDDNLCARKKR